MDSTEDKRENTFLGSGWAFPVSFSVGNYQLNTSSNETNINESINIILNTRKGERTLEANFGSGLQQFMFRKIDPNLKGEIIETIKFSLLRYEPRILVQEVRVATTDLTNGVIEILIIYIYSQTNTRHNYVFPFHLKEGTNLSRK
ncbi:phage tail protein [Flavobacterium cupreum]|uniref:Phage tail protein n=1 Tax=Flavobacterium cupreum TaxID=2133766 RepID=A0A434A0H6_9FLAO|nr:GPW/gp25 family protein [Flavobacterium cupreum]RUT67874.1 phage tail protein [Flavobacterium cupreum]